MPLECERSSASPSTTAPALSSAALIASEAQHSQQSVSPSNHLNEELNHLQVTTAATTTTTTSIMDGEMSTSQTSTTSNSSSCNGGSGRKTSITSPDPTAYVAKARVTRPTPPPPPYNPMQFVQIKPCNLYQTAQEQLKKAEEVKKIKEIRKEEPEDWQNNLDNWKSSRRKRVEHIIDRVVEVKKLELEEHDRTRRKSKTFSEMIEDRNDRVGRPALKKLASLAVYTEDESNDLSDLGIGTSSASGKSSLSEDYDNNSVMSDNAAELDKAITNSQNHQHHHHNNNNNSKANNHHHPHQSTDNTHSTTREYISSPGYETSSSTAPASTPDPCEYTYEGAIQDYKQRVSRAVAATTTVGKNSANLPQQPSKESTPERNSAYPPRRGSKIEDRLIGFEVQSPSEECIVGEKAKVDLPKIDISKRKEIFEAQASAESKVSSSASGVPRVTLRDRFKPSVESAAESVDVTGAAKKEVRRLSGDITSIKERLQSLEQQKQNLVNGATAGGAQTKVTANKLVDVPVPPLKERLSSLQNAVTKEEVRKPPVALVDARQLEIMKSEEEKVKQQQQIHKQTPAEVIPEVKEEETGVKSSSQINEISTTTTTTTLTSIETINSNKNEITTTTTTTSEVDRDDSGIHTADDIEVPDDHLKKEQELKLNAAIEALAMEEQQFAKAASAVNQIEAEFEELSLGGSVTLPPLANSSVNGSASSATTNTTTSSSITNDHMEYSINEALESALAAIDKESSNPHQQPHQTNEAYFPQPPTVPSSKTSNSSNPTTTIGSSLNSRLELLLPDSEIILTNKTDEETQFLSEGEVAVPKHLEIHEKSEEEISKEPIYENVSVQQKEDMKQQPQQQQTIIPSMNSKQEQQQQQPQQQSELNQNPEMANQNLAKPLKCSQINQSQTTTTTTAPILADNNNSNNNNNNNNNNDNNNVDDITNAFANTTLTTTTTKTTTNIAADPVVASDPLTTANTTNSNNNHSTSMFSETSTFEQTKPNIPQNTHNNNDEHSSSTPQSNEEPLEPYYQVPKSSEPYYDAPKHLKPIPVYENIEIFFNGNGLLGGEDSTMHLEPPKEKPPPPPIESPPLFDDVDSSHTTDTYSSSENTYETLSRHQLNHHLQYQQQQQQQQHQQQKGPQDHPSPPMKRMNSTKRIKKELRNKRSSFLGIEGSSMDDDDSYLELTVAPPPDMAQLLQEERRLEKQMYLKAGLCDSSDTGESRDSGVSENHSRQSSEHYTNSSEENEPHDDTTSPLTLQTPITLEPPTNDMIYQNDGLLTVAPTPLLQTVKGNSAESWTESATVAAAATQSLTEATATANAKMLSIEEKIREQEEVLRVERELLQLEQEELKRQRENLMLRENMARRELQHGAKMLMSANRRSLQDLNGLGAMTVPTGGGNVNIEQNIMPAGNGYQLNGYSSHFNQSQTQSSQMSSGLAAASQQQIYANIPNLQQQYYQMDTDYRKSMSDINEFSKRMMQPPPPVPPSKPMRAMHVNTNGLAHNAAGMAVEPVDYSSRQRHSLNSQHFGGSLVKIAPTAAPRGGGAAPHIYSNYHNHHQSEQNLNSAVNGQAVATQVNQSLYPGNMSRNTLHALSATPKPKYTDGWVQVQQRKSYDSNLTNDPAWMSAYQQKRKSMPDAYHGHNNNHWLVQEAEQRRLVEQQQQQRRVQSSSNTPTHKLTNGGVQPSTTSNGKPLPDSIIQTLTERVQSKGIGERKRNNLDKSPLHAASQYHQYNNNNGNNKANQLQQQSSNTATSSPHNNNLVTTTSTTTTTHRHTTMTSSSSNGQLNQMTNSSTNQDKVLSVSGKKKCSHCGDELGRGAAMIIESLLLFYHINCFKCCVCHVQLGDGLNGTDVRVRNHKLHCQNCYSSDDGIKFSCV